MARRLGPGFYKRNDVLAVARDLLGKVLCSSVDGRITKAVLVETEAYAGPDDRASHAFRGRRTRRTEPMFAAGGHAYVYLCYGIHHLFNVVTGARDVPHAVLVRAGIPFDGLETMLDRRGRTRADRTLMAGPGTLAQALGIRTRHSGQSLTRPAAVDGLWLEDRGFEVAPDRIVSGPRIGVGYAGADAGLPYRFRVPATYFDEAEIAGSR